MKCPQCRAIVDDGLDRCTFCGNYFQGSAEQQYKLDNYDPTAGYNPRPQPTVMTQQKPKKWFKLGR